MLRKCSLNRQMGECVTVLILSLHASTLCIEAKDRGWGKAATAIKSSMTLVSHGMCKFTQCTNDI